MFQNVRRRLFQDDGERIIPNVNRRLFQDDDERIFPNVNRRLFQDDDERIFPNVNRRLFQDDDEHIFPNVNRRLFQDDFEEPLGVEPFLLELTPLERSLNVMTRLDELPSKEARAEAALNCADSYQHLGNDHLAQAYIILAVYFDPTTVELKEADRDLVAANNEFQRFVKAIQNEPDKMDLIADLIISVHHARHANSELWSHLIDLMQEHLMVGFKINLDVKYHAQIDLISVCLAYINEQIDDAMETFYSFVLCEKENVPASLDYYIGQFFFKNEMYDEACHSFSDFYQSGLHWNFQRIASVKLDLISKIKICADKLDDPSRLDVITPVKISELNKLRAIGDSKPKNNKRRCCDNGKATLENRDDRNDDDENVDHNNKVNQIIRFMR